jgi:hypothetical protein
MRVIQNPEIDGWHSFLSGLDLRLKAARENLSIVLGEQNFTKKKGDKAESPGKKGGIERPEITKNQEDLLRRNISELTALIDRVEQLAKSPLDHDTSMEFQNILSTPLGSLFKRADADSYSESLIPGRIGTLVLNSTAIMLQCVDELLIRFDASDDYRTKLAVHLANHCQNSRHYSQAKPRHELKVMLDITTQESQVQKRILETVKTMSFIEMTRCCFEEHKADRCCDRQVLPMLNRGHTGLQG